MFLVVKLGNLQFVAKLFNITFSLMKNKSTAFIIELLSQYMPNPFELI